LIGKKVGSWLITEEIGDGGHAFVFKGLRGDETAAVKMLKPSACEENIRRRFELEADTLATLRHPNIVGFRDYIEQDGYHYLVIEYMDAGGIDTLLASGPMALEIALPIFDQVLQGIAHAHAFGFIHRDIKPNNVLLNRHGEAKIADFGIAKALGSGTNLTRRGFILGTSVYMAPEYLTAAECDEKTDVYALGVTLYEMLTGRRPFDFVSPDEPLPSFVARLTRDPLVPASAFVPQLPPAIDAILAKALERDKKKRYRSVSKFREDLVAAFPDVVGRPLRIRAGRAEALAVDGTTQPSRFDRPVAPLPPPPFAWLSSREAVFAIGGFALGAIGTLVVAGSAGKAFLTGVACAAASALASIAQRRRGRFEVARAAAKRLAASDPVDIAIAETASGESIPYFSGPARRIESANTGDSELGAWLVVEGPAESAIRFGLRPVSRIGRDERFDVRPTDPEISRQHAVVTFDGTGFTLRDLGSANGTFVNDVRIAGETRLRHGDRVRIGRTTLRFDFPARGR